MNDVFILGAQRTPIGSFLGALSEQGGAPQLGARAIEAATERRRRRPPPQSTKC